jgi:prevent-host-death family protein
MKMSASEFKARCLAVLDEVRATGQSVVITKRGRIVARVVPDTDPGERPWLRLRRTRVRWKGDPFAPAVDPEDIEALK